jgi:adenylate cyclase
MSFRTSWHRLAQALIGAPEFTSLEVAAHAGVDVEHARRLWRALGFPPVPKDDRVFTRSDSEMLGAIAALLDQRIAHPEVLMQLTRVTGQSLGRLAEAQVSAAALPLRNVSNGDSAAADDATIAATETLVPILEPFIRYAWRRHLLASLFRQGALADSATSTQPIMVVGFADLVDFTATSQALDESELAAMVNRFEALAYEHIPENGGRVVKMIGDEVMFAADSSFNAAEISLSLIEAFHDDDLVPNVRVGLALGPTLSWEGDLFGPTVNLASRLVNFAYPGTAVVSAKIHEELLGRPSFFLRGLKPVRLKGIGRTPTWVLRRASDEKHPSQQRRKREQRRRR